MKFLNMILSGLFALLLVACEAKEENEETPEIVKDQIGQTYSLKTVQFSDGNSTTPEAGLFKITLADEDLIIGNIACNAFSAKVLWSEGKLEIKNWEEGNKKCDDADPLVLDARMSYRLTAKSLILVAADETWKAIFITEKK